MAYMNDVMSLLEKALWIIKRQGLDGRAVCDIYIEGENDFTEETIKKIEETLAEHKALQVGHLARS